MDDALSLIGQLYDAALDPDHWTGVLGRVGLFVEAARALLVLEDAINPAASVFYTSFDDLAWQKRYTDSYMLINPARLAMAARINEGDTVLTTDYMTPAEYRETRFSKEFLADRRIADVAAAILEKSTTCVTVLSVQRSFEEGFADEALRRKLLIIMPHAQRAVKIARLLEHRKITSESLAETLDGLAAAVFLLTATGGVVHTNTEATRLLAEKSLAQAVRGALVLVDRGAAAVLARVLTMSALGDAALGEEGRTIAATTHDGRKYVLTVMPLTAGRRRTIGSPYQAVAAVCVKEAAFFVPAAAAALEALHDLTRRELAVLFAVVEQDRIADIAAVMGIGEATVKTHLKSIFRKTGARRQADLVKLAAGVAGPFDPKP